MSKQAGYPPIQQAVLIQAQQPMVVEPQMVQPQQVYAQNAQQQQYVAGNSVRAWGDATQNVQQTRVLGGFATAPRSVGAIGGVLLDSHSQGAPRFSDASPPFGAQPGAGREKSFILICAIAIARSDNALPVFCFRRDLANREILGLHVSHGLLAVYSDNLLPL